MNMATDASSTLSRQRSLFYRNQSTDLLCISIDWFLNVRDRRHEKVKGQIALSHLPALKVGEVSEKTLKGVII